MKIILLALIFICWPQPAMAESPLYVEEIIIALCNEHRLERGLPPLEINWEAARVARYKTEDMMAYGYFGHDSPVYGSFFDMLKNFHIPYCSAGENIAAGFPTPEAVVEAWMATPNHRQNILNRKLTQAGVGYSTDGKNHYWALILIG